MIRVDGLTVKYGDFVAVEDVSFEIKQGEIFGYIGPNGAGKTTTIRVMATLLEPAAGTIYIDGKDVVKDAHEVKRHIGYMPDFFGVYDNLKVWEYLSFFGRLYGVESKLLEKRIDDAIKLTHLEGKKKSYVEDLSRGMKQRLCLAKTLIHDPEFLILDEPASGLDPNARIEIRDLLRDLRTKGKTILISSHILSELADVCDSVGILEKGKLVDWGKIEEVLDRIKEKRKVRLKLFGKTPADISTLLRNSGFVMEMRMEGEFYSLELEDDDEKEAGLIEYLTGHGVRIVIPSEKGAALEEILKATTKGEVV